MLHHLCGKPIGRVVFAEVVAFAGIDEAFVQHFENVGLGFPKAEPANVISDAPHEVAPLGVGKRPIEKVTFDGAVDIGVSKRGARQNACRVVILQSEYGERDGLCNNDEKCVLEPEGVPFDGAPIDKGEKLIPQLPLKRRGWSVLDTRPSLRQLVTSPPVGDAILAQLDLNRQRVGRQ